MTFGDNVSMYMLLKSIPMHAPVRVKGLHYEQADFLGHVIGFGIDEYGNKVKVMPVDESAWYKTATEPVWVRITDLETI